MTGASSGRGPVLTEASSPNTGARVVVVLPAPGARILFAADPQPPRREGQRCRGALRPPTLPPEPLLGQRESGTLQSGHRTLVTLSRNSSCKESARVAMTKHCGPGCFRQTFAFPGPELGVQGQGARSPAPRGPSPGFPAAAFSHVLTKVKREGTVSIVRVPPHDPV